MRVRRLSLVRLRDEEHGATLAIVGISLLCLLGMLVLTFDLGRGVAIKRNMVNAADAGALAAARECGLARGTATAEAAAKQLVSENNGAAKVTGFKVDDEAQCSGFSSNGKRRVTVTASVKQDYFFAQIFGFDSGTVTASATAEWTNGDTAPAPLKLDQLKVDECEGGSPNAEGTVDCYFTFEKLTKPGTAQWGWLNLPEGWPTADQNPKNCSPQTGGNNDLFGAIGAMGGMQPQDPNFQLGLIDKTGAGNPPTWVCAATGHKSSSVEAFNTWVDNVTKMIDQGKMDAVPLVLFPVVACDSAKSPGDAACREWKYAPGLAYPVMRFQAFTVVETWDGQAARKQPNCKFTRRSSDVFCIHLRTAPADASQSGGTVTVRLVD